MMTIDPRQIETLAYQIWEEEGRSHGRHEDHWREAERRLQVEEQADTGADPVLPEGITANQATGIQPPHTPVDRKTGNRRQVKSGQSGDRASLSSGDAVPASLGSRRAGERTE